VIAAVVDQADPARMALSFPQIAAAARDNITTDIPLADLNAWVELTQKVKQARVRSLAFTSSVVDTTDPDFYEIRQLVSEALRPPAPGEQATPSVAPSGGASTQPSTRPSSGSSGSPAPSDPTDGKKAQDLRQVC
jgi:hypothetical protein